MSTQIYILIKNAKLQALSELNNLIFRDKKGTWTAHDVTRVITGTGGYHDCLFVLMKGSEIRDISIAGKERPGAVRKVSKDDKAFTEFTKAALNEKDIVLDHPFTHRIFSIDEENEADLHTKMIRVEIEDRVFGLLAVSTPVHPAEHDGPTILLSEAAKNLAFELLNREYALIQKKMEEKVSQSEKLYRTIFETTGNATIFIEEDTIISLVNREFENLSGYRKEEIEGKMSLPQFLASEDVDRMLEYHRLRRIDPEAAPRNYEFHFINRMGEILDIYMTIDLVPGTKQSVASFMNITEQKRLESEIIRVSEEERHRIGQDLHDGLGPHLVGVRFMINLLRQKIEKLAPEALREIDEINELVTQGVNHTRRLVKGLCPVDIDAEGLFFALDDLQRNTMEFYGIQCHLKYDENIHIRTNETAVQVFLITSEAVNNAVKHSGAENIYISLTEDPKGIRLSIRDDGIGIEKLLDRMKGMGINIMKYRARNIGASLDVRQNPGGGTSVICILKREKNI